MISIFFSFLLENWFRMYMTEISHCWKNLQCFCRIKNSSNVIYLYVKLLKRRFDNIKHGCFNAHFHRPNKLE